MKVYFYTADKVVLEMSEEDLGLITTMLGYSCIAAERRRHFKVLRAFHELSKRLLNATSIKMGMNGGITH